MTTETVASTDAAAQQDQGMRRDIGRVGLLFTGMGSIIGSGWLFGALYASQMAGPASILSWAIGGLMILLIGLVYAELGAMFPLAGGVVRFPHYSFGSLVSYTMGWITWIAAVTIAPIEVEGALQYATNYIPFLTTKSAGTTVLTPAGYGIAVALMLVFSLVNIMGVRAFAKANAAIVWWKLAIIVLVIAALLLTAFHPAQFTSFGGFAPYGSHGIFEAIAGGGIVFSFLGFRQGVELAGESKNPQRNVPFAVIGSVIFAILLYIGLEIAFLASAPSQGLAHGWAGLSFKNDFGPLAGIAGLLGLGWLGVLLYVDAFISPADTGLIYTAVTSRISYAMGKNQNAPKGLTKLTAGGVPWVSVLVTFVCGLIVFLPFPGWQKLVSFITSATVLSFGSGALVVGAMRRQLPSQHRPFRLPGGDIIPFLAFFAGNMIIYWSGWDTNWKLFVAIGLGLVLLAIGQVVKKSDNAPPLEWRAASWLVPWLAGLIAISALGAYGGGAHVISFGMSWVLNFVLSLVVYAMAIAVRLHPERVQQTMNQSAQQPPQAQQAS